MAPPNNAERWMLLASRLSVVVAASLIVMKAAAWHLSGSASLLGSLLDSVMDSLASIINLVAIRFSLKPADDDHRYGHGKAESLAAIAQALLIASSALMLLTYCIERLLSTEPHAIANDGVALVVMLISTVLTAALIAVQRKAIAESGSTAIKADSLHYVSDMAVNLSIIVALIIVGFGISQVDLYLGVLIALYIGYGAYHIAHEAIEHLMDKELDESVVHAIAEIAFRQDQVLGLHGFRSRQSGTAYFIQFHLEMDDQLPLKLAHDVAEKVETDIYCVFPNADVIIHQDPVSAIYQGDDHVKDRISREWFQKHQQIETGVDKTV